MDRPDAQPPDIYCRKCGARLEVRRIGRRRLRGLLGPRQWEADMVCARCGTQSGVGWTTMVARHPPRNSVIRLLLWLRYGRRNVRMAAEVHRRSPWISSEGRVDVAQLIAAVPFPVYGLKGRSLELRLRSLGWGGTGDPKAINRVNLGYVRGHPHSPEAAVSISQGPGMEVTYDALHEVESLLRNYAPQVQLEAWRSQGNFHQEWNVDRVRQGLRHQAAIEVQGLSVEAEVTHWGDQRVALARLSIGTHWLSAASLGLAREELVQVLGTLVLFQQGHEVLDEHQRAHDAVRSEMMEYYQEHHE